MKLMTDLALAFPIALISTSAIWYIYKAQVSYASNADKYIDKSKLKIKSVIDRRI